MGLNRLRGMWLSEEEPGQAFLFRDMKTADSKYDPVEPKAAEYREEKTSASAATRRDVRPSNTQASNDQLRMLLDQCLQVVGRDPEVALNGQPASWDMWFQEPLLSSVRCSNLPLGMKLRLMAFLALMLPFLDDREQDRVRVTISGLTPAYSETEAEILTEQDLIHTQWLVRAVRRSKDIRGQMEAIRRSILARSPQSV